MKPLSDDLVQRVLIKKQDKRFMESIQFILVRDKELLDRLNDTQNAKGE